MIHDKNQTNLSTSILPSFSRIRQQNLDILYGEGRQHENDISNDHANIGRHTTASASPTTAVDKSRMGHVDVHIHQLVDWINQNTSEKFVTLSSCSGRIVLFHPTATTPTTVSTTASQTSSLNKNTTNENINEMEVNVMENVSYNTTISGKGSTGSWVFVSHDVVTDPLINIVPFFFPNGATGSNENERNDVDGQECYFKFEPMLLHVAACNVEAGQLLLQLALQTGLRESGMIVTSQRVTVALRTHSLAMSVPLSFHKDHIFFPKSVQYVVSLTNEFNRRLLHNFQLIQKLSTAIQQAFLPPPGSSVPLKSSRNISSSRRTANDNGPFVKEMSLSLEQQPQVPALNLYGHTSIEVVTMTDSEMVPINEILVFGGYGHGPATAESSLQQSKMRSSNIYRLRQHQPCVTTNRFRWNTQWETIEAESLDGGDDSTIDPLHIQISCHRDDSEIVRYPGVIEVEQGVWDGRLHAAAVNLTNVLNHDFENSTDVLAKTTHILLFGGRYGPNKPMNDLQLFEYNAHDDAPMGRIFRPHDIHGTIPTPRWGHTLTPLNRTGGKIQRKFDSIVPIAVLVGGRDTNGISMDPLYVLSIVPAGATYHFLWEKLRIDNNELYRHLCRCYHTATTIDDEGQIFIFGGLFYPELLLESFDDVSTNADDKSALGLLLTLTTDNPNNASNSRESYRVQMDEIQIPNISHRFAHTAVCFMTSYDQYAGVIDQQFGIILLTGGVNTNTKSDTSSSTLMDCLPFVMNKGHVLFDANTTDITFSNMDRNNISSAVLNPGLLINHSCASFPTIAKRGDDSPRQLEVFFVGGGVSGFAFQDLFAPSLHCVITISWSSGGKVDDKYDAPQASIVETTSRLQIKSDNVENSAPSVSIGGLCVGGSRCDVVYVLKRNAKLVKQCLESLSYINKQYRMTGVDKEGIVRWSQSSQLQPQVMNDDAIAEFIAIPIRSQFMEEVNNAIEKADDTNINSLSLIVGYGQQSCLPSTGTYARGIGIHVR